MDLSKSEAVMVAALPRQLTQEIAVATKNPSLGIYPLYGGPVLPKDKIVRDNGFLRAFEIYWDLLRDPKVWTAFQKLLLAIVLREWEIEAASESAKDKKAANFIREQFENLATSNIKVPRKNAIASPLSGFDGMCYGLLKAIFYGFSCAEIIWGRDGKNIILDNVKVRSQSRFNIAIENEEYILKLITIDNQYEGEPLPDRKFIFHTFDTDEDNPYGYGLAPRLYWPVTFKRRLAQFSLAYADRFGMPTAIAKYPKGREDLKTQLLDFITNLAQESGAALPIDAVLEFIEAGGTGNEIYKGLMEYFDREIFQVVLGETGTSDQQGSGGSRARDQIGNEVRIEIAKANADLLSDTLNRTLIPWLTYYNFSDATPPKIWRKFPELDEKEDLNARANRDNTIVQFMGLKPTRKYVEETYEIELEEEKPEGPSTEDQLASVFGGGAPAPPAEEAPPQEAPAEEAPPEEAAELSEAIAFTQKDECKKGYSCGSSCISREKACDRQLPPAAKAQSGWLAANAEEEPESATEVFAKRYRSGEDIGGDRATTYKEARQNFLKKAELRIDDLAPDNPPPTVEEVAGVVAYSGSLHADINRLLRGRPLKRFVGNEEALQSEIKMAVAALDALPPHVGTVFRATGVSDEILSRYKVGGIVQEKGFISASKDMAEAESYLGINNPVNYTIASKNGKYIASASDHRYEEEVLFKPDTKFKVLALDKNDGITHIFMEEV